MAAGRNGRVFHYHADANPFGGNITAPKAGVFETQGSSSLSQAGGSASGPKSGLVSKYGMRVDDAYSTIEGYEDGKNWVTKVTSVVEGLDLLGLVKAEQITSTISIAHPIADPPYYPSVDFTACTYKGLVIDGQAVTPKVDVDTYSRTKNEVDAARCSWMDDIDFLKQVTSQIHDLCMSGCPPWLSTRYDWVKYPSHRRTKGHLVCSLVQGFTGLGPGIKAYGHVLEVPKLGFLFFGELTVDQRSFSLAMLRAEILPEYTKSDTGGSGLGATMGVAVAHTNGSGSP